MIKYVYRNFDMSKQWFLALCFLIVIIYTMCHVPTVVKRCPAHRYTVLLLGGTHGDEPAGTIALEYMLRHNMFQCRGIRFLIVPRVNACGLCFNTRHAPVLIDINRHYTTSSFLTHHIQNLVRRSDFIIDLHEAREYHTVNKRHLGNVVYAGNIQPSKRIANGMVDAINTLGHYNRYTMVTGYILPGSLHMYADQLGKPYIAIETTRTEPIQSRVRQQVFLVLSALALLTT